MSIKRPHNDAWTAVDTADGAARKFRSEGHRDSTSRAGGTKSDRKAVEHSIRVTGNECVNVRARCATGAGSHGAVKSAAS